MVPGEGRWGEQPRAVRVAAGASSGLRLWAGPEGSPIPSSCWSSVQSRSATKL